MKAVILAGGLGTRISEESHLKPKPMVEIGGQPILWHVMKIYAHHGINDFVVCLGYKGYVIKEYFANYFLHASDVTIDARANGVTYHNTKAEPWRVTLIDTGEDTMTGGRAAAGQPKYLRPGRPVLLHSMATASLISMSPPRSPSTRRTGARRTLHRRHPAAGRYGGAVCLKATVRPNCASSEKPPGDQGYVNGGFFVLESIGDRLDRRRRRRSWEGAPLERRSPSAGRKLMRPIAIPASGSRWTLCATRPTSRAIGPPAARRGKCGRERAAPCS